MVLPSAATIRRATLITFPSRLSFPRTLSETFSNFEVRHEPDMPTYPAGPLATRVISPLPVTGSALVLLLSPKQGTQHAEGSGVHWPSVEKPEIAGATGLPPRGRSHRLLRGLFRLVPTHPVSRFIRSKSRGYPPHAGKIPSFATSSGRNFWATKCASLRSSHVRDSHTSRASPQRESARWFGRSWDGPC